MASSGFHGPRARLNIGDENTRRDKTRQDKTREQDEDDSDTKTSFGREFKIWIFFLVYFDWTKSVLK
jgi:hypothetical protein